ncbi:MAG: hypothetical protein LBB74_04370 [Chitinispirillales bacterium]|nr:hypothetical protein [Chitinispirillales bacterium]
MTTKSISFLMVVAPIIFATAFCLPALAQQSAADGYDALKTEISAQQQCFSQRYAAASEKDKTAILSEAQKYLTNVICDTIFPYWYDTPWSFHGATRVPKQGTVACGYFVTGILTDAGFQIPRVKWAQAASENVIVKIAENIKRFRNRPVAEVIAYVNQNGDGLYIAGLDCHVGYIYKSDTTLRFVHSSYYEPETGVMSQPLEGWNPLNDSKYRVIGKLLGGEMVRNWVTGVRY